MNKQIRSILAQETTKTSKIRQLFILGIPRAEIVRMVTNGNYSFVVNALRRISEREGGLNIHPATAILDYTFNRKFGMWRFLVPMQVRHHDILLSERVSEVFQIVDVPLVQTSLPFDELHVLVCSRHVDVDCHVLDYCRFYVSAPLPPIFSK